jgi:glycerate dehydrogenase
MEPMKIVVLDGYTLNPGDLSWDALAALGELQVHDRTSPEEVLHRAQGTEILLTNKTVLSADTIASLAQLRYIGVLATGYNIVDVTAAAERGITVTNVPTYSTRSVAQLVFAHLLNFCHHVQEHSQGVRAGRWVNSADFSYWDWPLVELVGRVLGIVGYGRIGRATADLGRAFGMDVLAYDPAAADPAGGVRLVDLATVFGASDVVSLHCPLTPETQNLVNAERLALMKPFAILINTSRGPLIDEAALADALNAGRLAGAGLDVLSAEPPRDDNPLLRARNCVISPHIAWATQAARRRLMSTVVANIRAYLRQEPVNVVCSV